jgi:hypothetical protein
MIENGHQALLHVRSDIEWYGHPRQGRVRVYIDGKKCGIVPVGATVSFLLEPGTHSVRARRGLYASNVAAIVLEPGETVNSAVRMLDIGNVFVRIIRIAFDPFHALHIAVNSV